MTKLILSALIMFGGATAFAAQDDAMASDAVATPVAETEGLIPADMLDGIDNEALLQNGSATDDQADMRPRPRPRPRAWYCEARDFVRRYGYTAWNLNQARRGAMWTCQRSRHIGPCRLVGCRVR